MVAVACVQATFLSSQPNDQHSLSVVSSISCWEFLSRITGVSSHTIVEFASASPVFKYRRPVMRAVRLERWQRFRLSDLHPWKRLQLQQQLIPTERIQLMNYSAIGSFPRFYLPSLQLCYCWRLQPAFREREVTIIGENSQLFTAWNCWLTTKQTNNTKQYSYWLTWLNSSSCLAHPGNIDRIDMMRMMNP